MQCELTEKAKAIPQYDILLEQMLEEDSRRLENTKGMTGQFRSIENKVHSSMKWPRKLVYPMFEARAAYAVPNNYFQNIVVDGQRYENGFAHGAMRSVFFVDDRLILFSKAVSFRDAKEFFTSFLLLHLDKGEYEAKVTGQGFRITAKVDKPMLNLITGKVEKKNILFSFLHQDTTGRLVSKQQVMQSSRIKNVYERHGGAKIRAASVDMEGYAITVPHFSPHPYMLQLHKEFGFGDNKEFQEHVPDYFSLHLQQAQGR